LPVVYPPDERASVGKTHIRNEDSKESLALHARNATATNRQNLLAELQGHKNLLLNAKAAKQPTAMIELLIKQTEEQIAAIEPILADLVALVNKQRHFHGWRYGKERWKDDIWIEKPCMAAIQLLHKVHAETPGALVLDHEIASVARAAHEAMMPELRALRAAKKIKSLPRKPSVKDSHYTDNIVRTLRRIYVPDGNVLEQPLFDIQSTLDIRKAIKKAGWKPPKGMPCGHRLAPSNPAAEIVPRNIIGVTLKVAPGGQVGIVGVP
jgi:hypothetical protein